MENNNFQQSFIIEVNSRKVQRLKPGGLIQPKPLYILILYKATNKN